MTGWYSMPKSERKINYDNKVPGPGNYNPDK